MCTYPQSKDYTRITGFCCAEYMLSDQQNAKLGFIKRVYPSCATNNLYVFFKYSFSPRSTWTNIPENIQGADYKNNQTTEQLNN